MRLLTKKIHRAYPELDKFENDVCKRYIMRAFRGEKVWLFILGLLTLVPVSLAVWFGLLIYTHEIMLEYSDRFANWIVTTLKLIVLTGFVWFPAFTTLLFRDRWLHRCIRKQLTGVQCGACGYSLLGLTINNENDTPSVHCPECGHHLILKDMGLSRADIDPNYQPATP